ncbi:MAG: AAA family ATPase, partial [bacterium]|nr:AAA family ATPase [Candidatus Limimorpha equi]
MGIYLNPNNEPLRQDRKAKIFVDKSMIISELNELVNSREKYICVSRPRRFGKSMAGNMISAYYSKGCDSRELFKDLKIAQDKSYEEYLNKLNVIKIDMNAEYMSNGEAFLQVMQQRIMKDFAKAFPSIDFSDCRSFADCMLEVYAEKEETFVVIIDEYDVL